MGAFSFPCLHENNLYRILHLNIMELYVLFQQYRCIFTNDLYLYRYKIRHYLPVMGSTRVMQTQDDVLLKHTKYIAGSTHIATENRAGLRSDVFSGCHRHHQDFITEIVLKVVYSDTHKPILY